MVIDPQLLFQRFVIVAKGNPKCDHDNLFNYELSALPISLFDEHGLLSEANKAQLADTQASFVKVDESAQSVKEPMYMYHVSGWWISYT